MIKTKLLQSIACDVFVECFGGPPFAIGDIVEHQSGRMVKITEGQYWGSHGLCNFWHWREIMPDGKLSAKDEMGYGWSPAPYNFEHEDARALCERLRMAGK